MTAIDRAAEIIDAVPTKPIEFCGDVIADEVDGRSVAQALADAGLLVTDELDRWIVESLSALEAARTIGERHRTPLNYGNLDRLIDSGRAYLASRDAR